MADNQVAPWLKNLNPAGNFTGFGIRRFFYKPDRKEKLFLFYVLDKFLGANPDIHFSEVVDMAFCKLFETNPLCKQLYDAHLVRFLPDFFSAESTTLEEMKAAIEQYEQDLKDL